MEGMGWGRTDFVWVDGRPKTGDGRGRMEGGVGDFTQRAQRRSAKDAKRGGGREGDG